MYAVMFCVGSVLYVHTQFPVQLYRCQNLGICRNVKQKIHYCILIEPKDLFNHNLEIRRKLCPIESRENNIMNEAIGKADNDKMEAQAAETLSLEPELLMKKAVYDNMENSGSFKHFCSINGQFFIGKGSGKSHNVLDIVRIVMLQDFGFVMNMLF